MIICLLLDALASLDGIILIICNIFFNISDEKKLFISTGCPKKNSALGYLTVLSFLVSQMYFKVKIGSYLVEYIQG